MKFFPSFAITSDAFNRRLSKEHWVKESAGQPWVLKKSLSYVYVMQNEVGVISEKKVLEQRYLGLGKGGEIGATLLIRLNRKHFIPLHDHKGNISTLLDSVTKASTEVYRYSTFGQEQIYNGENAESKEASQPWRFSSKRQDPETGFVYFGERFYDPSISRWITPDPIGFEGGPNLYAYVYNNPLKWLDIRGLEAEGSFYSKIDDHLSAYQEFQCVTNFGYGLSCGLAQGFTNFFGTWEHDAQMIMDIGHMVGKSDFSGLTDNVAEMNVESLAEWTGRTLGKNIGTAVGISTLGPIAALAGNYAYQGARNLFTRQILRRGSESTISVAKKEIMTLTEGAANSTVQVANEGVKEVANIRGFTEHGINRVIQREIKPHSILDAVKNPLKINVTKIDIFGRPSQRLIGREAEVVINPETKRIISVNPTSTRKADKLMFMVDK